MTSIPAHAEKPPITRAPPSPRTTAAASEVSTPSGDEPPVSGSVFA
ncbi:MAG TPA: hypothetical protein VN840_05125 [Streptosporangiaceae bacterium]|nr:hypothetical protein [Streptosporangiaceae bacterium]